jgi:hypothetical protein
MKHNAEMTLRCPLNLCASYCWGTGRSSRLRSGRLVDTGNVDVFFPSKAEWRDVGRRRMDSSG